MKTKKLKTKSLKLKNLKKSKITQKTFLKNEKLKSTGFLFYYTFWTNFSSYFTHI